MVLIKKESLKIKDVKNRANISVSRKEKSVKTWAPLSSQRQESGVHLQVVVGPGEFVSAVVTHS